mmetsp:Transcript_15767/g.24847  ORF Transcript_15767/g.24847 Transcript_15767/m.24847 type:complete len:99 (+) Transcript_15767:3-299(+)
MNEAMEHVNEKAIDEEKLPDYSGIFSTIRKEDEAYLEYIAEWQEDASFEEVRDQFKGLMERKGLDYVNKFLDGSLNSIFDPNYSWRADALKKAGLAEV